jgi:large subunit ribosomal protein L31
MKPEIHPNYTATQVVCGCGNSFDTFSTYRHDTMRIDVCDACHPFYTGKHKIVDTAGRVEKFMGRYKSLVQSKNANEKPSE